MTPVRNKGCLRRWCISLGLFVIAFVMGLALPLIHLQTLRSRSLLLTPLDKHAFRSVGIEFDRAFAVGGFVVLLASDATNSVVIAALATNASPFVIMERQRSSSSLSIVTAIDAGSRSIRLVDDDGNGLFDYYDLTSVFGDRLTTFRDQDLNGVFDARVSDDGTREVWLDNHWVAAEVQDGVVFVQLEGKRVVPVFTEGEWRLPASF